MAFDARLGVNAVVARLSAEGEAVFLEYLDEFLIGDRSEPRHLFEAQA